MRLKHCWAGSLIVLGFGLPAYGQVSSINSVVVTPRKYNDVAAATLTTVTNYPALISFTEQNVSSATGFANRDEWHFSSDGGNTPYAFQSNDYFQISMKITLVGDPATPRKEAGFVFNNPANDGGEFILDTDAHEVVAFGGFLPFYAFPKFFNSGDTVTMGITYFRDQNGKNAIIYTANGTNSPPLELGNTEQGVINNTTIGGYFQIQKDSANPTNSGSASFASITVAPAPQVSIATVANGANQQVIFWPAALTNFVLQSTTNLASPNWTKVTNGTPVIGITVSNTLPPTFYRLEAP
ncbi:MAG TPA: hypothetical protein VFE51_25850 [Verrucomicrobiae bacterium]|nr:hypothetical protein [Verrucomicrobiae bacterium]